MDIQDVVQKAQEEQLRLVRFLYCDNGGIIRGKATHASRLASRMKEGIGQTFAMQAFSGVEQLAPVEGLGPIGEYRLIPDPDTFVVLPYAPKSGTMFCDMRQTDGSAWGACPRTFLKRMCAELAREGMRAEAAIEHEFYLARRENGAFVPADNSLCYSSIGLDQQAEVIDAILGALESEGIEIELFHTELGPAQQELSVRHADVLRAADNVCLVRETVRGVAYQHGLYATFAPKPFLDQAGNGAHIHFSLWSNDSGNSTNLLYDPGERGGLSQLGKYFIGGILYHIRALIALTCASPNSYRRLLPHYWSSAYGVYGFDNREAAIRVPSLFNGREAASCNLELKCSDHSGNPYLALGGLIAAGLDGIRRKIDPGEPQEIDPGNYSDAERERLGIQRFPTTLEEALNELEQDEVLTEALGPLLSSAYLAVKRNEVAYFKEKTPEEEALQHFYKY
ncbi:glutamine synthetase [Thermosporothrix hazakensis]|jgi:glutamine synthetase|uniref:Glutamine synthetase n=1 Tax=Thermosporothrix hazakensis TaxID=644383 RepID=A0A326U6H2_THEHA|nr:glutamine synthetase family protein [Thermosporothrix hazakensis]PZW27981.1 glutamine synthetase [Thermosporothrix hazakensis]GCE51204.1 glutamine synthetase [Thermosporothrix hazakensis]